MTNQQVDSAIRFTATESDLKAIRAAFEAVYPHARSWRKPDDKSVPEYEYYQPLARAAFESFRDGWLAARASVEPDGESVLVCPKCAGSGQVHLNRTCSGDENATR